MRNGGYANRPDKPARKLRRGHLAHCGWLLLSLPMLPQLKAWQQLPQGFTDCSSPGNAADPRCQQGMVRPSAESRQSETAYPQVPVLHDQGQQPNGSDVPYPNGFRDRSPYASPYPAPYPTQFQRQLEASPRITEFQRFVQQATGKWLPVYGADLFNEVPSTFALTDRISVTPDYTLAPGDQLLIHGWGQIDLNLSPVIDRSGAISIPQVGDVQVAGLQFSKIQEHLTTAIGRVFRNFELSVGMGRLRSMQVFVMGYARRPGAYTVSSLSTLVNGLFASGGPSAEGSLRSIRLTRGSQLVTELDLYDLLLRGDKSHDAGLMQGDVIYIPPAGPQVALAGSVRTPAIYEIKDGDALTSVLALAGGLTPVADRQRIDLERIQGSSRRAIALAPGLNGSVEINLMSGDIVNVPAIVPRFESTVTLRGNVADPIRVPWHAGMRIRDLIPNRVALLTREYWRIRNRLTASEGRPSSSRGGGLSPNSPADLKTMNGGEPAEEPAEQSQESDAPEQSRSHGLADATGVRSRTSPEFRSAPAPIAASAMEGTPSKSVLQMSAPEVNWNYAAIERLDPQNLRTNLIPFHLGKLLIDGDESENLVLEAGDVVTIYSTKDVRVPQGLQTRYVRLEGEFAAPGIYTALPGESLRQLVKRAGGFSSRSYLFGSVFQRESARRQQQQRLDDFVNSLEREAASTAANVRASVISPEDAAAAAGQINGQRELVAKLRQLRAGGRIVLDIDLHNFGVDALPDIDLEDGDEFIVPSRPSYVNVVGSVNNSTSFLYREDKRLGDYLREAGGATRTGDSHHAFLMRADGSVVSKSWASGLLSQSFEGLRLNPGDSVVVPEQLNRTTLLKGLKDWSQVFAQFALGAAAINILR